MNKKSKTILGAPHVLLGLCESNEICALVKSDVKKLGSR